MSTTAITLYEPADTPAIPSKKLGKAEIDLDTYYKIGGTGPYADSKPMRIFRLCFRKWLSVLSSFPDMPETSTIETIICEAIPIWRKGRDTYEWRAVVLSEADRERLKTKKDGVWCG